MNKIYKVLISILVISILASVGIAAKPPGGPTSEQIQDQRISALETNDTNQDLNNSEQNTLIYNLINDFREQVNRLFSQNYVIGSSPYQIFNNFQSNNTVSDLGTYTFYLPVDSYVYVESNVQMATTDDLSTTFALLTMLVDVDPVCGTNCYRNDGNYRFFVNQQPGTGYADNFQVGSVRFLKAGQHTVYLGGWGSSTTGTGRVYLWGSFNIIASQNKGLVSNTADEQTKIKEVTITKDLAKDIHTIIKN